MLKQILGEKALVLFSGGQDSTTCLYFAKEHYEDVIALNIEYGQRHAAEIESARKIAEMAGVTLYTLSIDLFKRIGNSALLKDSERKVTDTHPCAFNLPATFVPGRNIVLLTAAAMLGYKWGISDIITGVCEADYSGYPDCREETIEALEKVLSLGMDSPFVIHTPLMHLTKADSIHLARTYEGCMEALAWSHTCYMGSVPPCGECPSCLLRAKGFREAGIEDPLIRRFTTND